MNIKKYIDMSNYKRKLRQWIINRLAPTEFEYANSPFCSGDNIMIVVRDNYYDNEGLVVRWGRNNSDWYRDGYFTKKSVYKLYSELYNIQPKHILIIKEQDRSTEAIEKFIKEVKNTCEYAKIEVKNNNRKVRMFN